MTLKELGLALKQARELQGMSLDTVEKRIKVPKRILRAIEEGEQDSLPHIVYAKGFIKTYSILLGMDPAEAVAVVEEELGGREEDNLFSPPPLPVRPSYHFLPKVLLALTMVLGVAGGYFAYHSFWGVPSEQTTSVQMAATPAGDNFSERTGQGELPIAHIPDNVEDTTTTDAPVAVAGIDPANVEESGQMTTSSDSASVADEGITLVLPVEEAAQRQESGAQQRLEVKALQDCWVEAHPDGKGVQEIFLSEGQSYTFTFSKTLEVKLGNGGGVTLTLNGKPYPLQADLGKVLTLRLP